jgi:D-alanine--poly(phosphoribitol) ligase subunit 2
MTERPPLEERDVADRLRGFIAAEFGVDADDPEFTDEVDLFNYGYVDSLGFLTLTEFLDREFDLGLSESDLVNAPLDTIRNMASFVVQRVAERSG